MSSDSDREGRVSVWVDGERVTADAAVFWAAVERVEDPLENLAEFRSVLTRLS